MPTAPGVFSKNAGDVIYAADYNVVHNKIGELYTQNNSASGYGGTTSSTVVSSGTVITSDQFKRLTDDVARAWHHQNNTPLPTLTTNTGQLITAVDINNLKDKADDVVANVFKYSNDQLDLDSNASTRSSSWQSSVQHITVYSWQQTHDLSHSLNLGGSFTMHLSYDPLSSTGSGDDTAWTKFLDDVVIPGVNAFSYSRTDFPSNKVLSLTTTTGADSAQANFTVVNDTQLQISLVLVPQSGRTVNVQTSSTHRYYYSSGSKTLKGIQAPEFLKEIPIGFNDSGNNTIRITPDQATLSFTGVQNLPTNSRTLRLTNFGTNTGTVFSVNDASAVVAESVTPSLPIVLNSNSFTDFTIFYTGASVASGSSNLVFVVNKDPIGVLETTGTVVIGINYDIDYPAFTASATPASYSPTVTSAFPASQKFTITGNRGYTYTATISSPTVSNAFSLATSDADGPTLTFFPGNLPNNTYSCTVNISATDQIKGQTVVLSIPVSCVINIPADYNLGSWISAKSNFNSVVGVCYSMIRGIKTVTIGVGAGGDGDADLYLGGGNSLSALNLGAGADDKFNATLMGKYQQVLYKGPINGRYSPFLNTYGAWVRPNDNAPFGIITREYIFNVAESGVYNWSFGCDNHAFFSIDGSLIYDIRYVDRAAYTDEWTGTVPLTAGTHIIYLYFYNTGGPGSIGLRLYDNANNTIWSTLDPVRTSAQYNLWKEVYRVPLPGTAGSFYVSNGLIKDPLAVSGQNSYGAYLGTAGTESAGQLARIDDDGFGNLTISIMPWNTSFYPADQLTWATVANLSNSPYYYSEGDAFGRLTNLEAPTGSNTKFFTGFASDGTVTFSVLPYPTVPPAYPGGYFDGGGGGGDGGTGGDAF